MSRTPKMEQGVLIALEARTGAEIAVERNGEHLPGPPAPPADVRNSNGTVLAEQYAKLLNGCPLPVVTWRREGDGFVLVDFNSAAMEFFGNGLGEFIGMTCHELYPDHSDLCDDLERAFAENGRISREMLYTTRTQPARRLHLRITCASCPPDLVHMFGEDLTQGITDWEDRKKAEHRFRTLFEVAPVGIYQTGPGGRFEHVNMRLAAMYGFASPDDMELEVKDPRELFADHAQRDRLHRELAERGFVDNFECLVRHKDGTTFWVSKSIKQVRDVKGRVVSSMGFELDITERKMAEALREEVERITRHDLKSPLNIIVGMSDFMKDDGNLTQEQRDNLSMIEHSGNTMLNMINLSLAVYRMERGTYELAPAPVDLAVSMRQVLRELGPQLDALNVRVRVRIRGEQDAPGVAFMVMGDALLCWAMLYHLVQNAVDASPSGGVVTVDMDENGGSTVSVHNHGVVPPEVRENLFEKFVTFGKKENTGLGAYSARLIARTLGGDISLISSESVGTRMTVRLPRRGA
ncbi:PAS domain S-box-containing protein [Desulfobaculum xiamenense]|uniref:histidine kinase n=1 Tax=Desulfobaculum xiamenense TaxID=995050 RepID=A0A846QGB3_9BACT|nr:PAS domain-containing sensor histidine kinase [Desulfobaculum xiamenense]NJB67338.1 PAS domain S-box-containing protein [Desulfobaculum xiamenense]